MVAFFIILTVIENELRRVFALTGNFFFMYRFGRECFKRNLCKRLFPYFDPI